MLLQTERFGEIQVSEADIIHFPTGILGFEHLTRYVLVPHKPGSVFKFLQAVDDAALAFVVSDPSWFFPEYQVNVSQDDLAALDLSEGDESRENVMIFTIITVPSDPAEMTANLLAPVIINRKARLARQVVQQDSQYTTRHRIADELSRRSGEHAPEGASAAEIPGNRLVKVG